jgi:signal transduction histidine kinase
MNEEKNRVLGMAAHDLRTPLSSIYGFAHFLLDDQTLSEQQHDFVEVIARNARSMLRLVSDLLDIASIEAGRVRLDRTNVDVAVLVERTAELLRPLAERHGVSVRAQRHGVNWTALVDEGKVEQVVMNLATNALKFSPAGGRVDMTVRDDGAAVAVEVHDQGPGIPREDLGKLFAPFERTSVRPTREVKGTGLGLAIVHRIVVAHSGRVEIESSSGTGSLFRVVLPRAGAAREHA